MMKIMITIVEMFVTTTKTRITITLIMIIIIDDNERQRDEAETKEEILGTMAILERGNKQKTAFKI